MVRAFLLFFTLTFSGILALVGFRGTKFQNPPLQLVPDMKHQPKFITQHTSRFFADGRADHIPVPGTIPIGYSLSGRYYQTGVNNLSSSSGFASQSSYQDTGSIGEYYGDGIPLTVTRQLLERGRERYNIYCSVCHDRVGSGNGIAKTFGLVTVASLQDDRLRNQPDGQIFSTITHGKNTMGAYGPSISVSDRWAIVAYLRALQTSQSVNAAELRSDLRDQLTTK
jgi:hypothetical protein